MKIKISKEQIINATRERAVHKPTRAFVSKKRKTGRKAKYKRLED